MIYLFTYATLLTAAELNRKGLQRKYDETEMVECQLYGYRRAWNTLNSRLIYESGESPSPLYLGLEPVGDIISSVHTINGVIFPIGVVDLVNLLQQENIGTVYKLIDVTNEIGVDGLGDNDEVYALVTISPQYSGIIEDEYLKTVNKNLKIRGEQFEDSFVHSTEPMPQDREEVLEPVRGIKVTRSIC